MTLGMTEPAATATVLAILGVLLAGCAVFARYLDRLGVPVVLIFLLFGMLGGSEGIGGLAFDDDQLAFRLGTIALVLILFDGGLNTSKRALKNTWRPAGMLATAGVLMTAALLAVAGRLLGLRWDQAVLIGAIVSSTDAAAVFAVIRGGSARLKDRVRDTIEIESCLNDPMAVILTIGTIEYLLRSQAGGAAAGLVGMAFQVPVQLAVGSGVGLIVGLIVRLILLHARLGNGGLFPVVTLGGAFSAFGLATVSFGSGFLAVFVCAAVVGNGSLPYKPGLRRIHDGIAWISQVSMFLMLGFLVFPSKLLPVAAIGLALGLILAVVARPLAVAACLAPFRYPKAEVGYIGWVGLRGAVPIVLATIPQMSGLPGSDRVFHIVFFIVVVSAIVPGASIVPLARRLGLARAGGSEPAAVVELNSLQRLAGNIRVYHITPDVVVCGAKLAEIAFPPGASAVLVVRGRELVAARGQTVLEPGDHVHIFCADKDEQLIGLLFGSPVGEA
jgi:cell volume regulation protein A